MNLIVNMEVWSSDESWSDSDYSLEPEEILPPLSPIIFRQPLRNETNWKRVSFVKKLFYRELRGSFQPHPRAAVLKAFEEVPQSNQICLRNILPESAFHSNHVFLGLSKCGQFLVSYTFTADMDVVPFRTVYKYRLHWWTFVPHQRARKVAEVLLFGDNLIYNSLHLTFCQWPMDYSRVLVHGNCLEAYPGSTSQAERSYLTITTVPSLNKCQDCLKVAASYEEEDVAASWDSCLRFSCLQHGLTVHTTFDVVSPYPKFNPRISLKYEGAAVFNTGSMLFILIIDLEHLGNSSRVVELEQSASFKAQQDKKSDASSSGYEVVIASEASGARPKCSQPVNPQISEDSSNSSVSKEDCNTSVTRIGFTKNRNLSSCQLPSDTRSTESSLLMVLTGDGENSVMDRHQNAVPYLLKETVSSNTQSYQSCEHCDSKSNCELRLKGQLVCSKKYSAISLCNDSCSGNHSSPCVCNEDFKFVSDESVPQDVPQIITKECENMFPLSPDNSKTACLPHDQSSCNSKTVSQHKANSSLEAISDRCMQQSSNQNSGTLPDGHSNEGFSSIMCLKHGDSSVVCKKLVRDFTNSVFSSRVTLSQSSKTADAKVDREKGKIFEMYTVSLPGNKSKFSSEISESNKCFSNDGGMEKILDSTQELNITCSSGSSTCREIADLIVPTFSITRTLLVANNGLDSESSGSQSTNFKKRESGTLVSLKSRRVRTSHVVDNAVKLNTLSGVHTRQTNKMAAEAEKAYEFTEDVSETACEKLSSFRRRRLADKKYEFCEEGEDAENIVPFRLHRRRESSPGLRSPPRHFSPSLITHRRRYHDNVHLETTDLLISSPLSPLGSEILPYSPQSSHLETDKVLRPLNRNMASAFLLSPRDREASAERVVKSSNKKLQMLENVVLPEHEATPQSLKQSKKEISSPGGGTDPVRCTTELKRRFIEVDDELVSVITDIEDDELSETTGYHTALPLEVHGAGYVQLQMISNAKAEKLMAPCVLVHQRSFDVEKFCHEVAEKLCDESGKKYWFCNDYDVEIVDVCPFSGDVIALAVMRIQATVKTKGLAKCQRNPVSSMQRRQYQGGCKFTWNLVSGRYSVVEKDPLAEADRLEAEQADLDDACAGWNPAKEMAGRLRETLPQVPTRQSVRFITNELVLEGVTLQYLSDIDNMVGLVLQDEV